MDKKTIGDWIMYHEVQRLIREGFSFTAIGKALVIDRRTVKRYSRMSEVDYACFLESKEVRDKLLTSYETFVHDKLVAHPAVSAAQMHDWLKEYHPDFIPTAPKTVYNFVMAMRRKYNIPLEEVGRESFAVEELPYGQQAQADFGHYILQGAEDRRKRIHFFVMMLSRSRMKFVQFSDAPFTTLTAIDAHEAAFRFLGGIPSEMVYDQDRLFLVEERMGELLLTQDFKDYVFEQQFQLHFCRKADPQSKGKVENVVKYVKNNFLYARPWYDLQTLQGQAMAWLQRTGNAMPHATTRKIPLEEWQNEQPHLQPWVSVKILPSYILRTVRKDNTFAYLGNFYSVPQGTFKTKDTMVMIWHKEDKLHVHDAEGVFLCKHAIAESKGNTVINTDHKRDKSLKLKELLTGTASLFLNPGLAMQYFEMIRSEKSRYLRDQVQAIQKVIEGRNKQLVAEVLQKCIEKKYVGAVIFRELIAFHESEKNYPAPLTGKIILLDTKNNKKAEIQPDKSDLSTYEKAFENS
ncbi:MAG TPA: IS21 family transposase [Mucilaginibacter sp.]|nr:IS21 family transposase [Mucilaginibacter sp.]